MPEEHIKKKGKRVHIVRLKVSKSNGNHASSKKRLFLWQKHHGRKREGSKET